jgi:hypothetical protein
MSSRQCSEDAPQGGLGQNMTLEKHQNLTAILMESSLARLGSARLRLEPIFFIIAWKARAEKSAGLIWLNWKKFRLEKLDISEAKKYILKLKQK